MLCQAWRLPESVRLGVQYHHDPSSCDELIAHGVFAADVIAHEVAVRTSGSWSHSTFDAQAFADSAAAIGLDPSGLEDYVDATLTRFADRNTGLTL